MTAQLGRSLVIKLGDGTSPEVFNTIGGARSGTMTINNETVDITNKDDAGIRKLLEGKFGVSHSISLSGVYFDDSYIGTIRTNVAAGTHSNFQLVVPGSTSNGTYEGAFQITSYEESSEHNGEITYSITLESAGEVTFS